jgi:hypothetical protein
MILDTHHYIEINVREANIKEYIKEFDCVFWEAFISHRSRRD